MKVSDLAPGEIKVGLRVRLRDWHKRVGFGLPNPVHGEVCVTWQGDSSAIFAEVLWEDDVKSDLKPSFELHLTPLDAFGKL